MAEDARISTALPRHPKAIKLQRRLGSGGCWSLICLFLWVAENKWDGNLEGMSGEDIEIAAGWTGAEGEFARVLAEVRFLDGQENEYRIHDWAEHNPWAASRGQRIEAAKIAACARWQGERNANSIQTECGSNADGMRTASAPHGNSNAEAIRTAMPTTQPNQNQPNPTQKIKSAIPTLEEVAIYCQERRNNVDPQQWFDHYSSNGWKVGRNPMRDWKAAVRTWERNGVNHDKNWHQTKRDQVNQSLREAVGGIADLCEAKGIPY